MATLADVPVEVKLDILARLHMRTLLRVGCVSQEFCDLSRDPSLWQRRLARRRRSGWLMSDAAVTVYGQYVTQYDDCGKATPDRQAQRVVALAKAGARLGGAVLRKQTYERLSATRYGRMTLACLRWLVLTDFIERGRLMRGLAHFVFDMAAVATSIQTVWFPNLYFDDDGGGLYKGRAKQPGSQAIEWGVRTRLKQRGWDIQNGTLGVLEGVVVRRT
jgi:hypothetical protein